MLRTTRAFPAVLVAGAATLAMLTSPAAAQSASRAPSPAGTGSSAVSTAQSAVNYVALGDSYSSGVGGGNYISSSGPCDRSPGSYTALWAAANDPASYVSEACSGATTGNVASTQLSALSPSTTLVSITVGGDDAGFVSVMETCALLFFITLPCVDAVQAEENVITSDLPGELNALLAEIKADAPNATVVVLGYPEFFDLSVAGCLVMLPASRTIIDQAADLIDSVIQTAAVSAGDVFADVRPAFAGHEVCDSDSWINKLDWLDVGVSYHPTPDGYADAYLPVFSAAAAAASAPAAAPKS